MKRLCRVCMFAIGLLCALSCVKTSLAATVEKLPDEIPESAIKSNYIYSAEGKNGIYFINNSGNKMDIMLYDMSNKKVSTVYSINEYVYDIYSTDSNIYILSFAYSYEYVDGQYKGLYNTRVTSYNMVTGVASQINFDSDESWTKLGVDSMGRIYLAGEHIDGSTSKHKMALFSKDGELLCEIENEERIIQFIGFDSSNGNFYYRCYDKGQTGAANLSKVKYCIKSGNVTNNAINTTDGIITCYEGSYWEQHTGIARMFSNRYLGVFSPVTRELFVLDSNSYDYKDVNNSSGQLVLNNDVTLNNVYVSDKSTIKLGEVTEPKYLNYDVDCRCVINPLTGNPIVKISKTKVIEYDINTGNIVGSYETDTNIWRMIIVNNNLVLLERNYTDSGNFSVETVICKYPEKIEMKVPNSISVSDGGNASVSFGTDIVPEYYCETTDTNILSVDSYGNYCGNNPGTATLSAKTKDGRISASQTVTVNAKAVTKSRDTFTQLTSGAISKNAHNSYGSVNTYLFQRSDGGLTRAEYINNKGFVVEDYDGSNNLINSRIIDVELSDFGGFYNGSDAYYLVFGADNYNESNDVEVMRVVKYSKNWERLGQCSMSGCNTFSPFSSGSLRMTELDGRLYIHTCHTMYKSGDGLNHQANMTFVVSEADMTQVDSYSGVMNVAYGYVSHSFDQYIQNDGEYIYRVDLGDAYPRGVALTRFQKNDKVTKVKYKIPLSFGGNVGDNDTGCSLGGFELSASNCLITGSNYAGYDGGKDGARNAFVIRSNITDEDPVVNYFTNYPADSQTTCHAAKLVKLTDYQFLVMWEEFSDDGTIYIDFDEEQFYITTKAVRVDQFGNAISDVYSFKAALSDCQPIVLGDGTVSWISSKASNPILYNINPYDLSNVGNQPNWNIIERTIDDIKGEEVYIREGDTVGWLVEIDKEGNETYSYLKDRQGLIYRIWYNDEDDMAAEVTMVGSQNIKDAVIPEEIIIEGRAYKVRKIAAKAFNNCKKLVSVNIGNNVTEIKESAFRNCKKLSKVTMGKNVTTIGKAVWKNCTALKKITLNQKVKTLGAEVFSGCKALKSITLPKTVTGIGKKAFYNCKALKKITIKTTKLKSKKVGANAFKGINKKAVFKVPKKKLKAYKAILKKRGIGKKVKIKK